MRVDSWEMEVSQHVLQEFKNGRETLSLINLIKFIHKSEKHRVRSIGLFRDHLWSCGPVVSESHPRSSAAIVHVVVIIAEDRLKISGNSESSECPFFSI